MKHLLKKTSKIEKWLYFVDYKNSLLVAGLDPAPYELSRGDKGLPKHCSTPEDLWHWIDNYLEAIEPYCAGLKPNMKFFQESWKMEVLEKVMQKWRSNFFTIADSKMADLDSSNESELLSFAKMQFDCVTAAPYAGNLEGIVTGAEKYQLGVISMCLMSAQTYETTKHALIPINNRYEYDKSDVFTILDKQYVYKYVYDAYCIQQYGAVGGVIGAPSKTNGLSLQQIQKALTYLNRKDDSLVLIPGWGAQGGGIEFINEIGNYAMVNQSRGLMFPNGSDSTPSQQGEAAKRFATEIATAFS